MIKSDEKSLNTTIPEATTTARKMKFSFKDFCSKCERIRSFLRTWSHLLKKSLMKNLTFCAVHRKLWKFQKCFGKYLRRVRASSIFAFQSNFTYNSKTNDFIKFFMILWILSSGFFWI